MRRPCEDELQVQAEQGKARQGRAGQDRARKDGKVCVARGRRVL